MIKLSRFLTLFNFNNNSNDHVRLTNSVVDTFNVMQVARDKTSGKEVYAPRLIQINEDGVSLYDEETMALLAVFDFTKIKTVEVHPQAADIWRLTYWMDASESFQDFAFITNHARQIQYCVNNTMIDL